MVSPDWGRVSKEGDKDRCAAYRWRRRRGYRSTTIDETIPLGRDVKLRPLVSAEIDHCKRRRTSRETKAYDKRDTRRLIEQVVVR